MSERLERFSSAHIWIFSIVISVLMTECIVVGMELLLKGSVTVDYLLTGLVASVFVAGLVGGLLNFFLTHQMKIEAGRRIVTAEAEAQDGLEVRSEAVSEAIPYGEVQYKADEHNAVNEPVHHDKAHTNLRQAIKNLDVLPAMPIIAQRLLALNLDTEEGEQQLLVLIGQDPQISAKILGMANSAMVSASRQIATVREATLLLGTKRIQSVATGIAIISLMTKAPVGEFNVQSLWLHSFRVAFATQGIARIMPANMRPHEDQIFLAAMLHDIGYLVLAYLDPKLSDKLHNHLAAQPERPAMDVEREILDICHDELGAELAQHWNLPEEIIAVLRYHHTPDAAEAAVGQPLVRMIGMVEGLLPPFDFDEYVAPGISDEEWELLGISPSQTEEVKELIGEQVEQATQFASSFI